MYILSVDFGTSSVKMSILDKELKFVASTKTEYFYKVIDNDKVELDPDEIFAAFIKGLGELEEYLGKVEIIGYCTFSPSLVLMDSEGKWLYPIVTHLDRRSRNQSKRIVKEMGKEHFQAITGTLPHAGGVSITTVLWFMENMPQLFQKTYKFGHFNTYIYKLLTGCWATDPTNAAMMGLYNTVEWDGWSDEILKTFKIPVEKLPDIYRAGTVLGTLNKKAAGLTGLKEGIPVILGSNDVATAQIGAGNTNTGDILNISGSSEMVSIITDKPVINEKYYVRNAITPGKWQIYATTVGGFAIEWFRKQFYDNMDVNYFYNNYLCDLINNGLDANTVKFLPYLAGDRQSLKKKRGVFSGLTLDSTKENMLSAILIGIHEPIKRTIKISARFLELNKTIKVTGGLSGEYWLKFKKDMIKGFDFVCVDNCPIIGNAILALQNEPLVKN